ncbi:MAG: acyl carrier protein [Bacteroidota bacterium]
MTTTEIQQIIIELIAKAQGIAAAEIRGNHSFPELGLDSLAAMFLLDDLEKKLGREINPMLFWEHPTIEKFAASLANAN